MKLYLFPPSARVLGIVALKNHLALDCEMQPIDLGRGDQLTPQYLALNPNKKMPTLEDDGFVLWESNAILFYMAAKRPETGLWPSDLKGQADVLRWLAWESAHWDAESCGMVAYEKASKTVLGLGPPTLPSLREVNRTSAASRRYSTNRSEARPGSLANGSRLRIFPSGGSCHQSNACSFPSETSPKSFAGTQGSRPYRLGRTLLQPRMRLWRHGSRKELHDCRDVPRRPHQLTKSSRSLWRTPSCLERTKPRGALEAVSCYPARFHL
jgi:hypothetical protein